MDGDLLSNKFRVKEGKRYGSDQRREDCEKLR